MKAKPAYLILKSGEIFDGIAFGHTKEKVGELVFNTSMTGYQEIITDLSYTDQLICFTYPHIGNVGTNLDDHESSIGGASGVVIRDLSRVESNWRNEKSLSDFLKVNKVPGIRNIDTRKLTRVLRKKGSQPAFISYKKKTKKEVDKLFEKFGSLKGKDLATVVSTKKSYKWSKPSYESKKPNSIFKIIALDFGVKHNILRLLVDRGCSVEVMPANTDFKTIIKKKPDGVFLSNGPGDPEPCHQPIDTIAELINSSKIPLFGICLGHQLLGLALGMKTEKMKFGHHGANHPVKNLLSNEVAITSQNHGFTISEKTLADGVSITHRSLFDNSIQGISFQKNRVFGFQGHPEASPGPQELQSLFDTFINQVKKYAKKN
ncbi:MAG: carbamoyl-phosphate synthase small subunit [Gammaproteobacteria bacterium]|nr:MAG: carbamoyl-phosphate synthase small subunit [Gammaproteobacteria bacterium]